MFVISRRFLYSTSVLLKTYRVIELWIFFICFYILQLVPLHTTEQYSSNGRTSEQWIIYLVCEDACHPNVHLIKTLNTSCFVYNVVYMIIPRKWAGYYNAQVAYIVYPCKGTPFIF